MVACGFLIFSEGQATAKGSTVDVQPALQKMYGFDFPGAHQLINQQISENPNQPTAFWVRAAAYLFGELDRLQILQSEFFESDKRISDSKKIKADPAVKVNLFQALADCRSRAQAKLAAGDRGPLSRFALAISDGIESDYLSLIEKRQIASLRPAKESQRSALELLKDHPGFVDAKLTTGISEYLVSSLPTVVRWFVHFDGTEGDKKQAVANLTEVSERGIYLGPFARILRAIIAIREKRPQEARTLLAKLSEDYPENPLFRRELRVISEDTGK